LRRCPVVTLELAHGSARLWVEWRIYLSRERLECSDVLPGARTDGASEEDAEGREAEAAMALLRGRAPVEYTYTALGVLGEVAVWGVCGFQKGGLG